MEGEVPSAALPRGRVRWWWLVAILLAGGALLGGLQTPELFPDDAHRNLATIAATLLVTGMLTLWAIFGTGLARAHQIRLLVAAVVAAAALIGCFRVEGYSGNLTPRVTWRWAAKPDESLATRASPKPAEASAPLADLNTTTDHDFPQFLGPHRDATVEAPAFELD
ncbi:MAG TPA: hypothetical protein PK867_15225, partial [Pirellulales bacterium]|nr:hypothetical protein [Pirellulales bacterium]